MRECLPGSEFPTEDGGAKGRFRKETHLHGLVNNAGIMAVPFAETSDGFEIQFQARQANNPGAHHAETLTVARPTTSRIGS